MPRPKTKDDLLAAMQKEHDLLGQLIDSLSPEQLATTSENIETWTVKDILAHITAWEQMCLSWYQAGLRDEVPPMPAEGFNWRQIPDLNQQVYKKHRLDSIDDVLESFQVSYREILEVIQGISEEEMFTPQRYRWTRKNAMGTYFVSATSSHYNWARKEIKQYLKRETTLATSTL